MNLNQTRTKFHLSAKQIAFAPEFGILNQSVTGALSRVVRIFIVLTVLGMPALAQSTSGTYSALVVTGTGAINLLQVTGTNGGSPCFDIFGNSFLFGSWSTSATIAGIAFGYSETSGTIVGAYSETLTRPNSNWNWLRLDGSSNAWPVMNLTQANQLVLTGSQRSNPGVIVVDPTAGQITINNQSVLTANQAGLVGIGTTNPTRGRLELDQSNDSISGGLGIANSGTTNSMRLWVDGSGVAHLDSGAFAQTALGFNTSGTGAVGIGTATPTMGRLEVDQSAWSSTSGIAVVSPGAGATGRFWVDGGNRVRLDNGNLGGAVVINGTNGGWVGIGSSSPQAVLDVSGSTTTVLRLTNLFPASTTSGAGVVCYANSIPTAADQRLGYYILGAVDGGSSRNTCAISGFSSQPWVSGSSYGSYVAFATTPNNSTTRTEVMRITQNGAVGVGTASPQALLDVSGSSRFGGVVTVSGSASAVLINPQGDLSMGAFSNGPRPN